MNGKSWLLLYKTGKEKIKKGGTGWMIKENRLGIQNGKKRIWQLEKGNVSGYGYKCMVVERSIFFYEREPRRRSFTVCMGNGEYIKSVPTPTQIRLNIELSVQKKTVKRRTFLHLVAYKQKLQAMLLVRLEWRTIVRNYKISLVCCLLV